MRPANLAARSIALILDGLVTFVGLGVLFAAAFGQLHHAKGSAGFHLHGAPALLWIAASWLYWVLFEAGLGTTPGKRLFRIRVVGESGGKPSLSESAVRNLLRVVDGLPYIVPYLFGLVAAATDPDRRRIGDRVAGTRVVAG